MEPNPNIRPADGFCFLETDGTTIKGTGWASLERNVAKYRANKGVPDGNVHADIVGQVCKRQPGLCGAGQVTVKQGETTLKGRVFAWLGKMSRLARENPLDYVSDKEARRRAAICAVCPKQRKISHICTACTDSRKVLRGVVLSGRKTVDPKLEACDVLAVDLQAAVHLAETPETNSALPEACWRRSI